MAEKKEVIGLENPGQDFKNLVDKECVEADIDEESKEANFERLSSEMRDIIMDLIKSRDPDIEKIRGALKAYHTEALFYNPYAYNEWIRDVKNVVIERKLFDFWQNVIVKDELGLLWARNCDFFDDLEDEEPIQFYKIEGQSSKSPSSEPKKRRTVSINEESNTITDVRTLQRKIAKIGQENPGKDFTDLVHQECVELDAEEDERHANFERLSKEIRDIITDLIKKDNPDTEKIRSAIKAYHAEALFYNPFDYNTWIRQVKQVVIERKLSDFWNDVIVKEQLGLLWARNCDFFDDIEDTEPEEFYKI